MALLKLLLFYNVGCLSYSMLNLRWSKLVSYAIKLDDINDCNSTDCCDKELDRGKQFM